MVNPFLAATPERAKQMEAQQQEASRWGHAEYFRFSNWPAIAFDLDHTLASYRLIELHKLCYNLVVAELSKHEYASFTFREFGNDDLRFAQRGIYYDKHRGVVMKIDGNGDIEQAYHGTTRMEKEEIDDIYAGCRQLLTFKYGPYKEPDEDSAIKPILHCFNDNFTTSTIYLLMELVQLNLDGKKLHQGFDRPFRFLMQAYSKIFDPEDFAKGQQGFFSALQAEPTKYIKRLSFEFVGFIKRLRRKKIATIIVTNSAPDFANFVLKYILGDNWKKLFDAVIYDAKKPSFFSFCPRPFYQVDETTGQVGSEVKPQDFTLPLYVSQGSISEIKHVTKAVNGHLTPKMLYVGDSLVNEIYACFLMKHCGILAVVDELANEYDTAWGSMMGTAENPSYWCKKLEDWSTALLGSVEVLQDIHPSERIMQSTHLFRIVRH